jgi:hypothetical protein
VHTCQCHAGLRNTRQPCNSPCSELLSDNLRMRHGFFSPNFAFACYSNKPGRVGRLLLGFLLNLGTLRPSKPGDTASGSSRMRDPSATKTTREEPLRRESRTKPYPDRSPNLVDDEFVIQRQEEASVRRPHHTHARRHQQRPRRIPRRRGRRW